MRSVMLTAVVVVLTAFTVWLVHALVLARQAIPASAATVAAAGRPTVVRPGTNGGYLASPGIYAGPAPTGPLPPPPGPGLLPTGFQSRTFYSIPPVDPALDAAIRVSGSGPNGTVGPRGMRVDRVTPGSRLDSVYGLRVGDEIVEEPGMSAADDAAVPTVVAKARMLATIGSGNEIKVRRGGRLYYLMQDRPPGLIP